MPEENESEAADSVEATLPGPASAVEMESSFQVDVLGGDGSDVGLGVELMETEDQEAEVTLPAQVTTSPVIASAADTGAEDAEASAGQSVSGENVENSDCTKHYKCSVCQKQYRDKQYYRQHLKNHQYGKQYKGHSV